MLRLHPHTHEEYVVNTLLSGANHGSPPTIRRNVCINNPTTSEYALEALWSRIRTKREVKLKKTVDL